MDSACSKEARETALSSVRFRVANTDSTIATELRADAQQLRRRAVQVWEVLKTSTDYKTALRECALCTSVNNLEEELAHSCVDSVANKVGIQSLKDCLTWENLRSHSC